MTDQSLLGKIQKGRLQGLLQSNQSDEAVCEELFLAILTRFPSAAEKKRFEEYRLHTRTRQEASATRFGP